MYNTLLLVQYIVSIVEMIILFYCYYLIHPHRNWHFPPKNVRSYIPPSFVSMPQLSSKIYT